MTVGAGVGGRTLADRCAAGTTGSPQGLGAELSRSTPTGKGWDRRTARDAGLVGLVALLVRLTVVLALPAGEPSDMRGWLEATQYVYDHGLPNAYAESLQGNLYPPGFIASLWLTGQLHRLCCGPKLKQDTRSLQVLIRLPPILADAVVALLVYRLVLLWGTWRAAWLGGLVYALNPAALTIVAWFSMLGDPYYQVFVLLSLLAAIRGAHAGACLAVVLGAITKPQALAFGPLIGALTVLRARPGAVLGAVLLGVGALIASLLPFIVGGTLRDVVRVGERMAGAFPFMQVKADNLWYLLSAGRDPWEANPPYDTDRLFGLTTYRDVGLLLFASLYGLVAWRLLGRTRPRTLVAAAATVAMGFFMLSTRMHANYIYPLLALLAALCPSDCRRYGPLLAGVTCCSIFDLAAFDELLSSWIIDVQHWFHLVNAGLYVLLFLGLLRATGATTAEEPRSLNRLTAVQSRLWLGHRCLALPRSRNLRL